MKYAITGHTNGIGKEIFDCLAPECVGFSRSNGYNIAVSEDRKRIIDRSVDCDIFINNAYDNFAQVDLLYELFDQWQDQDKLIINIGSDTTCGIKKHIHSYSAKKAALDKSSEQLAHLKKSCKVTNLKFGYVGTTRIINSFNPTNYIDSADLTEFIIDQIKWAKKYRLIECLITA